MDKYEEALERAREWEREHPNGYVIRDMMEFIFPGYNDSEDECTRKELIHFILYKAGQLLDEETEHKFVVYLEKQKEQKPSTEETELNSIAFLEQMGYTCIPPGKEQKTVARENDFVSNPKTSVEVLRHYLVWAGNSEEEDCPYTWKTLADAIRDGIKALEGQKPAEKSEKPIISEWSEEDEKMRAAVLQDLANIQAAFPKVNIQPEFDWLKSLPKRFNLPSKSEEWSEEDEFFRQQLIVYCEKCVQDTLATKCVDWLKSLRSKPHWRPSEEQMEVFFKATPVNLMPDELRVYHSLCSDLKKL